MKKITLAILTLIIIHSCSKPYRDYDICGEPEMELRLNYDYFFKVYNKSYRDSLRIFPKNKTSKVFPGIVGYWKGGKSIGDTITLVINARNKRKFIISQDCLFELTKKGEL
ncbi:MAG: hypothetical protein COA58_02040 [Bacteroidetes bacterium]|nr:MAG: hypothetical protein COA58_02040 [Bacteroidota bacterium]